MTYRQKYELDHPEVVLDPHCMCPSAFGYTNVGDCLNPEKVSDVHNVCNSCWDREMPSLKAATMTFGKHEVGVPYSGRKPIEYVDTAEFANAEPHILDSGNRQQFETGAVRDIPYGKGRCDLMPLEVVAKILNGDPLYSPDLVVGSIALFKNSDYQETTHLYGAIFHFAECWSGRNLDITASFADIFLGVAKHFEEGAKKYGENNWKKGIPANRYIDSAVRHYLKWLRGDNDEPHALAFVWNLICCIWEVDFSPRANGETAVADTITIYADNTPIEHIHSDLVRYGDCPAGLFELGDEGVYVKTEIADADKYGAYIAIHVNTGHTRLFDNDILVRPIDSPFTDERCGDE